MKVDGSQKKQLIVLSILMVIAIVYGVMTLTGGSKAPAGSGQTGQSAKPTETTAASAPVPAPGAAPEQAMAIAPLTSRDPFSPQIGPLSTVTKGVPPAPDVQSKPLVSMLPPVQVSAMPSMPGTQSAQMPQPAQPDPAKVFSLTGVIRGRTNVAVISTGGPRSSIVREGQTIDGRYKVESISSGMVLIKHEGRTVVLRLGGNQVGARL